VARKIGLVGLGLLGSALAERFLRARFAVSGHDLSPERRAALEQVGGRAAGSATDVARDCDVLVLSLPNSDVVADVMRSVREVLTRGQLVIDTTTGEPEASAALGAELAGRGVDFLDATVAGSSQQAREAQAIVMAGGEQATFDKARDVLAAFARQSFYVGPWGSGARMKLVVNLVLGLHRAVLAEGLMLARSMDLDPLAALAILKASPAYSTVMDTKGAKMLSGDFEPQARLSQHLKDVRLILAAGQRTGALLPLSNVHRALLEQAEAMGLGELDNSAIIRAFEPTDRAHRA
jgi:3-hydroxyisobutyrate dehydrogenase-like beta-hydroxyacid dehydrogenase